MKGRFAFGANPEHAKRRSRYRRDSRKVQILDRAPGGQRYASINEGWPDSFPNPFQATRDRRQLALQRRYVRHRAIDSNFILNLRDPARRLMFREVGKFGHLRSLRKAVA